MSIKKFLNLLIDNSTELYRIKNCVFKWFTPTKFFIPDEQIPAFDLQKCCWNKVNTRGYKNHEPNYPAERDNFEVTSYTDPDSGEMNVIISEGRDNIVSDVLSTVLFKDVWKLNLTSLKWTCIEKFGTVLPYSDKNHSIGISPAGQSFTLVE